MPKRVGPNTIEVALPADAKGEARPSVSATYRNTAAADGLPTTVDGCSTLYEVFNHAVQLHPEQRCGQGGPCQFCCGSWAPWTTGRAPSEPLSAAPCFFRCLGWRPSKADGSAGDYEWLTYAEVAAQARVVATALAKLGFKPKGGCARVPRAYRGAAVGLLWCCSGAAVGLGVPAVHESRSWASKAAN